MNPLFVDRLLYVLRNIVDHIIYIYDSQYSPIHEVTGRGKVDSSWSSKRANCHIKTCVWNRSWIDLVKPVLTCERFLSWRVFGLLSSSVLLFPQRFGRYVPRPSSCFCRTRKPSRNFELRPLLNPWGRMFWFH